jgi:hypothetical protein
MISERTLSPSFTPFSNATYQFTLVNLAKSYPIRGLHRPLALHEGGVPTISRQSAREGGNFSPYAASTPLERLSQPHGHSAAGRMK